MFSKIVPASLSVRLATLEDRPALDNLRARALSELLAPDLTDAQHETVKTLTPFDDLLIRDGTYFAVEYGGAIIASGGWTRRKTLFRVAGANDGGCEMRQPDRDAAGIRAMYTDPVYARMGLGSLLLSLGEASARLEGFRALELIATSAGEKLYRARGWHVTDRLTLGSDTASSIQASRMEKSVA